MPNKQLSASNPPGAGHLYEAWRGAESICIKCGFCLPACPTYRLTGAETHSPRGRLELFYAVAAGRLTFADIERPLASCLGCLACETACPSAIRYRDLLDAAHQDRAAKGGSATPGRSWRRAGDFLLDRVLPSSRLRFALAWGLAFYQRSGLQALVRASQVLRIFPRLRAMEGNLPIVPLPRRWKPPAGQSGDETPGVLLFTGCVMETVFAEVHEATEKVLRVNGIAPGYPGGQTCCGALHHHAGRSERARELARRNIAAFEAAGDSSREGTLPVLVNSAGCGALLKDYGRLLADDPDWSDRAAQFADRVRDISEFLAGRELTPPTRRVLLRVAYDDPCHLLHAQGVSDPPRQLLERIPGVERVELPDAATCCGSAGTYSLAQPENSQRLLAKKIERISALGVNAVATGNPGCLLHIRLGARMAGLPIQVVHPIELLARAYED